MVKVGKYDYEKSTRKGKKLMVKVNNKTIHFGNDKYEHYEDKTGIWKLKDHGDKVRQKSYLARAQGIKKKDGTLAYLAPENASYHAVKILW